MSSQVDDAAKAVEGAQAGTQQIPPNPLPVQYQIGQAQMPNGEVMVLMNLVTPAGSSFYFLPPDFAQGMAKMLERSAHASKSGLFLPGPQ